MVTIRIGTDTRRLEDVDESWITQRTMHPGSVRVTNGQRAAREYSPRSVDENDDRPHAGSNWSRFGTARRSRSTRRCCASSSSR
jgi:hypothetical protein